MIMKKLLTISAIFLIWMQFGCVQKTRNVTIQLNLRLAGMKNITQVGVRGNGKPLSWQKDLVMSPVIKDSLYTVTIHAITGYNFAEIKFTVNGTMELDGMPNRRVDFKGAKSLTYNAVFNKP
ncbi:hypothetical protein HYN43_028045 [Mucilaginibacter celer]|uniref:Uncharacterized protein n=2 Tax=Mucilaginibacter celer TaxID=2305508 RepID=A0A494VWW9_9SPHI|nr:hypothetical protein HYN43_028045 [Mucilaginibacter celer]